MITTPFAMDIVRGAAELETTPRGVRPHRLPAWVRDQFPDPQLLSREIQPSGVRIVFRTAAARIELRSHSTRTAFAGADRARGSIDSYVDGAFWARDELGGGDATVVDLLAGSTTQLSGAAHTTVVDRMPARDKLVELWLPHNESLELLSLESDGPLAPNPDHPPVWMHHGSSISHGSNATAPSEIWPAVAARRGGVDLLNLGFGGSALVDPFMARVMRDTPADVISVKLGINVVNFDAMRLRAFVPAVHGFLDTIRDGHPTTPLVLVSPIFCGIHEHTAGPGAIDPSSLGTDQVRFLAKGVPGDEAEGRLTLSVIRRELRSLASRRAADPNLYFLEGTDLYGEADAESLPLADALHPGPEAHRLIGSRFADYAFAPGGPFA
ncbi:lipase [Subtercola boreus]|uniref:Lipase n=1 Tax=Subtercola boreus TaxID=120213 RepID=A0A3E0VK58_9MICO|nr:SGNH/GDSL hydrolase family protein [Subtercola boreus]RFA10354.1 lipase [Subtercola boreus]TQL56137.1 GDSL-like lipase/acylhydrolase family protein [Subtercola boreus]